MTTMRSLLRSPWFPACALLLGAPAAAWGQATTVRFDNRGTFSTPTLVAGALSVDARTAGDQPGALHLLNLNGLGVAGGYADSLVDRGEAVRFRFTSGVEALAVSLGFSGISNLDLDADFGEAQVEAFDLFGQTLGSRSVMISGASFNVSALYGNQALGSLVFRATDDGFQQSSISFTPHIATWSWSSASSGSWAQATNWDRASVPDGTALVTIAPAQGLRVDGPAAPTTVRTLTLGATGSGVAVLALGSADFVATGTLRVDPRGQLETGGGVVRAATLQNAGTVRGSGQIDAVLQQVAGARLVVDGGQRLLFGAAAAHANAGSIEVGAGELAFMAGLSNAAGGSITARDAVLRFDGGLDNAGRLVLTAGLSDVHGAIANTGQLALGARAEAVFHGDLAQLGSFVIPEQAYATVLGRYSGGGFTGGGTLVLLGDLQPGDLGLDFGGDLALGAGTRTEIEFGTAGGYDRLQVLGQLSLDGTLEVARRADFHFVAGQRYLIAGAGEGLSGQFLGLGAGALVGRFDGIDLHIDYGSDGVYLAAAVPEPASWALLAAGLAAVLRAARRSRAVAARSGLL